jgi:NADH-quinone oxidoreductase subunit C
MTSPTEALSLCLKNVLGEKLTSLIEHVGEVTIEVRAADLVGVCHLLRDHADLRFEELIDLCGVDYLAYGVEDSGDKAATRYSPQRRFAVVYHLLSISHNRRLRLKVFCPDDDMPLVRSVIEVWSGANWFEREAFDLYGIVFAGHPDLRRILTDYGFIGHPFRKDFPLEGNVEMRYDPEQQRVVYQPVSIENRVNIPRVIREENYGG